MIIRKTLITSSLTALCFMAACLISSAAMSDDKSDMEKLQKDIADLQKELKKAIYLISELYDKGYSVMDILDNYFIFVKSSTILNEEQKFKIIPCICKYITIFHNIHEDEIELSLFTNNIIETLSN